jgi:hypothetical protein
MFLLLTKNESMKTINFNDFWFSWTYLKLLLLLFNYHLKRLFKAMISSLKNSIDWVAWDKSNVASSWHINVRYASRVIWATYWFLNDKCVLIISLILMKIAFWFWIRKIFSTERIFCLRMILSFDYRSMIMSLNLIKCSNVKWSLFLCINSDSFSSFSSRSTKVWLTSISVSFICISTISNDFVEKDDKRSFL